MTQIDAGQGFKKVGHKKRRGRKGKAPAGHRGHRTGGAVADPITRGLVRMDKLRRRDAMLRAAPTVEDFDA